MTQAWECTPGKELIWNVLSLFTTSGMLFLEVSLVAFLFQGNHVSGLEALTRTFIVSGLIVGLDLLLKVLLCLFNFFICSKDYLFQSWCEYRRFHVFFKTCWQCIIWRKLLSNGSSVVYETCFRQFIYLYWGSHCLLTAMIIHIRWSGTCGLFIGWFWLQFMASYCLCTIPSGEKDYLVSLSGQCKLLSCHFMAVKSPYFFPFTLF